MSKSKEQTISAVHEKDLKKLLTSLNLLKEVNDGHIKCNFCGKTITLENLQCIYPANSKIVFCCDDIVCFEKTLLDSKEEKSKNV